MKRIVLLLISGYWFLVTGFCIYAQEEDTLTIVTYYPAPYGAYQNLNVTGNVGIGTTNPLYPLNVNGDINISANKGYYVEGYKILTANHSNRGTFVGENTGINNASSGYDNTFMGYSAGYSNTDGDYNTFIGRSAGYSNTTGSYNTFLGYHAGYRNTGSYKTFVGNYAGYNNTTGGHTFIGYQTGYNNTTGGSNTFVGYLAGRENTRGFNNTFLGDRAGLSNTTGVQNTFLGNDAGYYNTTGGNNTFVGMWAGFNNTTARFNTFVGTGAGYTNTTGNDNTFVGEFSGNYNSTGTKNTYLGENAGNNNSTGSGNVCIGYQAGYSNTYSDRLYIDNSSTSTPLIYGDFSTNRVGINTIPGTAFAVSGLTGTSNGSYLRIYNNDFYSHSSSRKIKEDIKPLINEDFYKILKAEPKSFIDKPTGERNIGYIAEEFDEIGLKNLVGYKDGEPETIKYELISLYLIEIIKNQQREINELRTKIEALQ